MTKARELLYTGNLINAAEAKRLNLVNQVVPADKFDAEGLKAALSWSAAQFEREDAWFKQARARARAGS